MSMADFLKMYCMLVFRRNIVFLFLSRKLLAARSKIITYYIPMQILPKMMVLKVLQFPCHENKIDLFPHQDYDKKTILS